MPLPRRTGSRTFVALLAVFASSAGAALPAEDLPSACPGFHADADRLDAENLFVGTRDVLSFDGDAVVRAQTIVVHGALLAADAKEPAGRGGDLCIVADSLLVASGAVVCAGRGAAAADLLAPRASDAEGGAGGRGGDLRIHVGRVDALPGSLLCAGDGGDGGSVVALPGGVESGRVTCPAADARASARATGGTGGDAGRLVAEGRLALAPGSLRLGSGGAGGHAFVLGARSGGHEALGGAGGASGAPAALVSAAALAGGVGGRGGDAAALLCLDSSPGLFAPTTSAKRTDPCRDCGVPDPCHTLEGIQWHAMGTCIGVPPVPSPCRDGCAPDPCAPAFEMEIAFSAPCGLEVPSIPEICAGDCSIPEVCPSASCVDAVCSDGCVPKDPCAAVFRGAVASAMPCGVELPSIEQPCEGGCALPPIEGPCANGCPIPEPCAGCEIPPVCAVVSPSNVAAAYDLPCAIPGPSIPCVPEDTNPDCILHEVREICYWNVGPHHAPVSVCGTLDSITGLRLFGEAGESVEANPSNPGDGAQGYDGRDGAHTDAYSFGLSIDATGVPGADASVSCPGANRDGEDGEPGDDGGHGDDGGAVGGRGGFGFLLGGDGGRAHLAGAWGGHGGAGGKGGAAKIESTLCGIERAAAGRGGSGGAGGSSGGGDAVGGQGGSSPVQPGRGGGASAEAGAYGVGGRGGDGGASDSVRVCEEHYSEMGCVRYGERVEPAGEWGCGGLRGRSVNVYATGGPGGRNSVTDLPTGSPGEPPVRSPAPTKDVGTSRADHGSGTSRSCDSGDSACDPRARVHGPEFALLDLPTLDSLCSLLLL